MGWSPMSPYPTIKKASGYDDLEPLLFINSIPHSTSANNQWCGWPEILTPNCGQMWVTKNLKKKCLYMFVSLI